MTRDFLEKLGFTFGPLVYEAEFRSPSGSFKEVFEEFYDAAAKAAWYIYTEPGASITKASYPDERTHIIWGNANRHVVIRSVKKEKT